MRTCRFVVRMTCLVTGALLVAVQTAEAAPRPFDDAKFIMDVRGDLNNNGKVDATELGNMLDVSADTPVTASLRMAAPEAEIVPPNCTNILFAPPIHAMTTNLTPCVYFPQTDYYDENGIDHVTSDRINFVGGAVTGSDTQTAYIRFRWEGSSVTNFTSNCWLFLNGYTWEHSGWGVYVSQSAGLRTTEGTLGYMIPKSVVGGNLKVKKNVWYDLFVTVKPLNETNSVFQTWLFPTPDTTYLTDDKRVIFRVPGVYTERKEYFALPRLVFKDAYKDLRIGCESDYTGFTAISASNNNAAKSFRGAIARLMLWNRELTFAEMQEIQTGFSGAIVAAGVVNGSADEFSDAAPAEVFHATNDWKTLRKTLTETNPSIALKGALPAGATGCGHVLAVAPLFSGTAATTAPVRVDVNGTKVGVFDLKQKRGRNIFISGKFMQRDAQGNVTVALTRLAPFAETLELDAVRLGGSWCVGAFNDSNSEMERESAITPDFVVGDPNFKHARRAVLGADASSYSEFRIHADCPIEGVNRQDGVFRVRTALFASGTYEGTPWTLSGHTKLDVRLNGVCITNLLDAKAYTTYDIPVAADLLQPGMNVFSLSNALTQADLTACGARASWFCFDAFRFTLNPAPNGSLFILR